MTFTDDNLKRLKESLERRMKSEFVTWVEVQDMQALLSRLEAAEALLPAWQQQNGEPETRKIYLDAEKAWRKAAGR